MPLPSLYTLSSAPLPFLPLSLALLLTSMCPPDPSGASRVPASCCMAAQALRSTVAAAGDAKAQGAALCAGLAALAAPGSELDKAIVEVFRLSTETVFPR